MNVYVPLHLNVDICCGCRLDRCQTDKDTCTVLLQKLKLRKVDIVIETVT